MKICGIDYPKAILDAMKNNSLVIFAGAGVSKHEPSACLLFRDLCLEIAKGTGLEINDKKNETLDHFLGRISNQGSNVKKQAAELLRTTKYNEVHKALLRLFPDSKHIKLITTNFDLLFEEAAKENNILIPRIYSAPAMPLGRDFNGLVHLHGDINFQDSMVLDDRDFGRSYVSEGWASRFLLDVCRNYTILFIGYSHDDTIMRYFSRGITKDFAQERYILTFDDSEEWEHLGIIPITFERDNWEQQKKSILQLEQIVNYDFWGWEGRVKGILENKPTRDPEDVDLVKYILEQDDRIKIFTDNAKSIEWVHWLNANGYLECFLKPHANLSLIQEKICTWLLESFAVSNTYELIDIFGKEPNSLNSYFLNRVLFIISNEKKADEFAFKAWGTLLLQSNGIPQGYKNKIFTDCNQAGNFLALTIPKLFVLQSNIKTNSFSKESKHLSLDLIDNPHNYFDYKKVLIAAICDHRTVLYHVIGMIHRLYNTREFFSTRKCFHDSEAFRRSAIEQHEQDKYKSSDVFVFIDLIRDIMLHLRESDINEFDCWLHILITDKATLLKRIAIHIMADNVGKDSNTKLMWLIKNVKIHDSSLHHEVFPFLKKLYPTATDDIKKRLVSEIIEQAYNKHDDLPDEESEDAVEYKIFTMAGYIDELETKDEFLKNAIMPIKAKHPSWELSEFPDFTFYSYSPTFKRIMPWSIEELYSISPAECISRIISYKPENHLDDSLNLIYSTLAEMTKERPRWGIDLLNAALIEFKPEYNIIVSRIVQVFTGLCKDIKDAGALSDLLLKVYHHVAEEHLICDIIRIYTAFLAEPALRGDACFVDKIHSHIIEIWGQLKRVDVEIPKYSSWMNDSLNHPAGVIAEFLIENLSCDQKESRIEINKIPTFYTDLFTLMCKDQSYAGILSRVILFTQTSWLNYLIPDWTKKVLLPLLKTDNNDEVWEGFLRCNISYALLEEVFPYFKGRISGGKYFRDDDLQEIFIKRYSDMIIFYSSQDDFLNQHIPQLFQYLKENERKIFSSFICTIFCDNNVEIKKRIWIEKIMPFLKKRLENKPCPISKQESEEIIQWAECMDFAFEEYVSIIEKLPNISISDHQYFIHRLNEDNMIEKFGAENIGRLLLIFIKNYDRNKDWTLHGIEGLWGKIKDSIPSELRHKIMTSCREGGIKLI